MIVAALLTSLCAFILFGLATDRHHERRLGRRCSPQKASRLRTGAWGMLAITFIFGMLAWGAVFGPIAAIGMAMLAAGITFLGLNLFPVRRTGK